MRFQNWLLFLLVVVLCGSNWSVMKIGFRFVSPTTYLVQRFAFSTVAMSPVLIFSRGKFPKDSGTLAKLVLLSLINVVQMGLMQVGLVEQSSGVGSVLTYTQPLFVFCLATPFLRERVTSIKLLGAVIGFLGIVVLFLDKLGSFMLSSTVIMILGAFLYAVTIVYYKKYLTDVDPLVTSFFQLVVGMIPLSILGLITNGFALPGSTGYLWTILYTSIGVTALATTVWLFLIRDEDVTVLAGSSFLIPLIAFLFGWQLLGETIQIGSVLGSALILAGVYFVNSGRRNEKG